jgi:hypothetical protein
MELAPVSVAHVAAREDDLCQIAMPLRNDPARDDLKKGLKGRGREDGNKMLWQIDERRGKFHGSTSLPGCLFGL